MLERFLTAVEKVAITSIFAFTDDYHFPRGKKAADVCSFIKAAKMAFPLVIHFKRDNTKFFRPSLTIAEVLPLKLEKYVDIVKQLCEKLEKRLGVNKHKNN